MRGFPQSRVGFAIIALLVVGLPGCSLKRSPEDVSRQFMEAWRKADEPGMRALMTRTAREKMDRPFDVHQNAGTQYGVGQAAIQDDFAQVPVTVRDDGKEEKITIKLRQDEGEWRVYALTFPLTEGGPEVTFDMEHPEAFYGDLFKGLGQGLGAMFKGMGEGMGAMLKGLGEGLDKLNQATPRQ
jgi:hypothetical protein